MEVHDFRKDFLEEVKSTAATEGAGSNAAFVSVTAQYLINSEVLNDFNPAFYIGTGKNNRKLRVDGYVLDEFDLTLNLIIADYTGDENRDTLTKSQAETQFERVTYFLDEVYKGSLRRSAEPSTPVFDLIELLWSNQKRIRKYRYILLTDSFMSSRITELETKTYNDIPR